MNKMAGLGARPGVLLVQKRTSDNDTENIIEIKFKAEHGSYNDENNIHRRSCFGKSSFNHSKYVHIHNGISKVEKAALEAIVEIGLEVNKISKLVAILESEIYRGKRVSENAVLNLVELLMAQLLKLDEIVANGNAKLIRKEQVKRVQKYIEDLDRLQIKNASNESKSIKPIRKPLIYFS